MCPRGLTLSISLPLSLCEATDNTLSKHSVIRLKGHRCLNRHGGTDSCAVIILYIVLLIRLVQTVLLLAVHLYI